MVKKIEYKGFDKKAFDKAMVDYFIEQALSYDEVYFKQRIYKMAQEMNL